MHIQNETRELLKELINTGVGRAAKTLNELLQHEIEFHLPDINVYDIKEMEAQLATMENGEYVGVFQSFDGHLSGTGILSFPVMNGKTLINLLMENEELKTDDTDLSVTEMEAICEVGNNIINSVQGTISDMVGLESQYHLPETIVSSHIIPRDKMKDNEIYLFGEVGFKVQGMDVDGMILMIYAYKNIEIIMNKYMELLRE